MASLGTQYATLKPNTQNYLQETLETVKANILINYQNGKDEADALILQDFFRITAFNSGIDNPIAGIGLQKRIDTLKKYNIPIGTLLEKTVSSFDFEDWVQQTIEDAMKNFSEKDIVSWSDVISVKGNDSFDLYEGIIDPIAQSAIAEAYKHASQTYQKNANKANYDYQIKTEVYGKIDTGNFYCELKIATEDPYLQQLIPLLASSTFTDKGYLTKHDVRLGQTNPFRVFMAVTSDTYDLRLRHWYAMLECMKEHSSHGAPRLFYELRYIYELTGYGGSYVREAIQTIFAKGARFFLYLSGSTLKVIPVSRILVKLNQKLKNKTLIRQSSINMHYSLYAILKLRITATDPITFELE